jgi:hypothetical protein
MTFATDIDLLRWEPTLFDDAAWASQTLLAGTGTLAGTTFTIDAGSLIEARAAAGHVLRLAGGSYPIVAIGSATTLTVSVLYDALFDEGGTPVAPPAGSDLEFSIRTFSPQLRVVSDVLRQAAGIVPGTSDEERMDILNPAALRRPCALGALQMIYSALAAAGGEEAAYLAIRADLYERLYQRALRAAQVEIDTDNDGRANIRRPLSVLALQRV